MIWLEFSCSILSLGMKNIIEFLQLLIRGLHFLYIFLHHEIIKELYLSNQWLHFQTFVILTDSSIIMENRMAQNI